MSEIIFDDDSDTQPNLNLEFKEAEIDPDPNPQKITPRLIEKIQNKIPSTNVSNPSESPYSNICRLIINYDGTQIPANGTGSLILPNVILTVGHNIFTYNSEVNSVLRANRIQIIPGGGNISSTSRTIVRKPGWATYTGKWKSMIESKSAETANDRSSDYALLFLDNPINLNSKPFKLSPEIIFPSRIAGLIKIAESQYDFKTSVTDNQTYVSLSNGNIITQFDTTRGSSGSSIFFSKNENYYIFAVHSKGRTGENLAAHMSIDTIENIKEMMRQQSELN